MKQLAPAIRTHLEHRDPAVARVTRHTREPARLASVAP
jgi:hypothetical protein